MEEEERAGVYSDTERGERNLSTVHTYSRQTRGDGWSLTLCYYIILLLGINPYHCLLRFNFKINSTSQTLTFADETLLGDGLLAYITTLGLLEWLQLEGVCVDALQLVGLREEEEGRESDRE